MMYPMLLSNLPFPLKFTKILRQLSYQLPGRKSRVFFVHELSQILVSMATNIWGSTYDTPIALIHSLVAILG